LFSNNVQELDREPGFSVAPKDSAVPPLKIVGSIPVFFVAFAARVVPSGVRARKGKKS